MNDIKYASKFPVHTELVMAFLRYCIGHDPRWSATVTKDRCIHLMNTDFPEFVFSPLTAVYYCLTRNRIHRGTFFVRELTEEFGIPWYEVVEISYADMACDCGRRYNRYLRNLILRSVGMPEDPLPRWS